MSKNFLIILSLLLSKTILSELPELTEMVIGKETIDPGIEIIFEGAIKDDVSPAIKFVSIDQSDIHLEVLANWNEDAPSGSPVGGFVAYLNVSAEIINQSTSETKIISLLPHINLLDNLHYALNTKLPGNKDDLYSIKFLIQPPESSQLGLHFDWRNEVGSFLSRSYEFEYKNLDFTAIANAKRR